MTFKKLLAAMFLALVTAFIVPSAFAEDHACTADTDCEEGQHCKEGHCH